MNLTRLYVFVAADGTVSLELISYAKYLKRRAGAIWCALYFGFVPWKYYEKECHYAGMSYYKHLLLNIGYALKWLFFLESESDVEFEKEVNARRPEGSYKIKLQSKLNPKSRAKKKQIYYLQYQEQNSK